MSKTHTTPSDLRLKTSMGLALAWASIGRVPAADWRRSLVSPRDDLIKITQVEIAWLMRDDDAEPPDVDPRSLHRGADMSKTHTTPSDLRLKTSMGLALAWASIGRVPAADWRRSLVSPRDDLIKITQVEMNKTSAAIIRALRIPPRRHKEFADAIREAAGCTNVLAREMLTLNAKAHLRIHDREHDPA